MGWLSKLFTTGHRWRNAYGGMTATVGGSGIAGREWSSALPQEHCDPLGRKKWDAFAFVTHKHFMQTLANAYATYCRCLGYSRANPPPPELWKAYVQYHVPSGHGLLDKIAKTVKPFAEAATETVANVLVPGTGGKLMHEAIQAHEHHQNLGQLIKRVATTFIPDVGMVQDTALKAAMSLVQRTRAGDASARAAIQQITQGIYAGDPRAIRSGKIISHLMHQAGGGASAGESLPPGSAHGHWVTARNGVHTFVPSAMANVPTWMKHG